MYINLLFCCCCGGCVPFRIYLLTPTIPNQREKFAKEFILTKAYKQLKFFMLHHVSRGH